ncbi:MAG: Crp/Fnr family transcriptional regulator [Bacteroidota bacterium]
MQFVENLLSRKVKKKVILVQPGDICHESYFVLSGCLASYVIDASGKEHILQFAPENWMVTDLESFIHGTPAKTYVAAIEDSEFKVLPKSFFEEKANLDADQLLLQNRKLINNIIAVNNRLMGVLGATAEERYLEFIQLYPDLFPRLSVKLIASYIGITPEYLSEIRGKLTKGE